MLIIRQEQLRAFSRAEVANFEEWMLAHLRKFFPAQCRAAGESGLQKMIRRGIERAASYRITTQRDVCKYIDLMVVLGSDFDTDPRLSWAKVILKNPWSEGMRMRRLVIEAQNYLRQKERQVELKSPSRVR
jgi:hypothetical protein